MTELIDVEIQAAWERGGIVPDHDPNLFRSSADKSQAVIRRDLFNSKEKFGWKIDAGFPVYCGSRPSTAYTTIIRRRRR